MRAELVCSRATAGGQALKRTPSFVGVGEKMVSLEYRTHLGQGFRAVRCDYLTVGRVDRERHATLLIAVTVPLDTVDRFCPCRGRERAYVSSIT